MIFGVYTPSDISPIGEVMVKIMDKSILREKSFSFAKEIVFTVKAIQQTHGEFVLTKQLLRSGTSIGANVYEAKYAQSNDDFISKLEIALKECFETEYWLNLLYETNYLSINEYQSLTNTCGLIRRLLISSCKTAKQ